MHTRGLTTRIALLTCLIVAAVVGLTAASASAKTFVVKQKGDHVPGPCTRLDCTLREAVMAATARPSNDRIKLPKAKTYRLKRDFSMAGPDEQNGDLDVGVAVGPGNMTKIVHSGPGKATIDASATGDRVIEVVGNIELRRVKLTGGISEPGEQSGGALNIRGFARLEDTVIVKNEAPDVGGGIFIDSGVLLTERVKIRRNTAGSGGGLFINPGAHADLVETTVARNEAGDGGGMWVETDEFQDSTRLIRSTFSGNVTSGDGGAIFNRSTKLLIENSTLAGNSADERGGAIYGWPESLAGINAATIARNLSDADDAGSGDRGGGIYADGGSDVVTIKNSLVVKNTRGPMDQIDECYAPAPVGIESQGGNLISSPTGGCDFFDHPEDIVAPNVRIEDLGNYGGPTRTIALKAGSPAINEADGPLPFDVDQRGELRTDPDIGAYER